MGLVVIENNQGLRKYESFEFKMTMFMCEDSYWLSRFTESWQYDIVGSLQKQPTFQKLS